MSVLVLVRHGKASAFSQTDYDQLSEPGVEQSRLLGVHFAEQRVVPHQVFVGPRRRHQQTLDHVLAGVTAAGLAWPEAQRLDELDEHDGLNLVFRMLPEVAREDERTRAVVEAMTRGETPSHQEVLAAFRRVTRRWARGELSHPEVEAWGTFRARVARGLEVMTTAATAGAARGQTVIAFTSGGTISAAVGHVLGLDDEKVLDLSWALHNAALSELMFSESGWGLRSFNGTPHLRDARLVTSV